MDTQDGSGAAVTMDATVSGARNPLYDLAYIKAAHPPTYTHEYDCSTTVPHTRCALPLPVQ